MRTIALALLLTIFYGFTLAILVFFLSLLVSCTPAQSPLVSRACVNAKADHMLMYLDDLERTCGTYTNYDECPGLKDLELRYAKLDQQVAEKCIDD